MKFLSISTVTLLLILAVASLHLFDGPTNRTTRVYQAAAEKALPSSVLIQSERWDPLAPGHKQTAHGSGTIISSDGYILTAEHVLLPSATTTQIYIYPNLETGYNMIIVAQFYYHDVAILKIEAPPEGLEWSQIADSQLMRILDPVISIGHPRQVGWTVTEGRINRKYEHLGRNVLQVDAVNTSGGSGGGIFNLDGNMVGIFQSKITSAHPGVMDGEMNLGIESWDLLNVLDVYRIIKTHRITGLTPLELLLPIKDSPDGLINSKPPTYRSQFPPNLN